MALVLIIPVSHRDLLETPIPVALATIGPTGYPQVTYVWVVLDGDSVVTSLTGVRQKLKNLRVRPQGTVFAADPANPYRTLEVRGDVTIEPDPELVTLQAVLAAYGTDLASLPGAARGPRHRALAAHPRRDPGLSLFPGLCRSQTAITGAYRRLTRADVHYFVMRHTTRDSCLAERDFKKRDSYLSIPRFDGHLH